MTAEDCKEGRMYILKILNKINFSQVVFII